MSNYKTKAKEVLVDFFKQNPEKSFSSRQVINCFGSNISEPTIYRLLKKLSNNGVLRSFNEEGKDGLRYQFYSDNCHNHIHLTCLKCGNTYHLDCGFMEEISKHIKNEHNFILDNSKSVMFGVCGNCGYGKNKH